MEKTPQLHRSNESRLAAALAAAPAAFDKLDAYIPHARSPITEVLTTHRDRIIAHLARGVPAAEIARELVTAGAPFAPESISGRIKKMFPTESRRQPGDNLTTTRRRPDAAPTPGPKPTPAPPTAAAAPTPAPPPPAAPTAPPASRRHAALEEDPR